MYILDIANKNYSSWSLRSWVLLTTLGIPFEERFHRFPLSGPGSTLEAFSPTGLVPVLHDGDLTVWDSLAIAEYVAESHPAVWPRDKAMRAWARSATAEMHAGFRTVRTVCSMNCGVRVTLNEFPEALRNELRELDKRWVDGLDRFGGPFLAGKDFTAVDAFFCPVAFRVQTYGLELSDKAMAYAKRLLALPAMQDWYDAALKEDFRNPPYDKLSAANGKWTADYRATAKA